MCEYWIYIDFIDQLVYEIWPMNAHIGEEMIQFAGEQFSLGENKYHIHVDEKINKFFSTVIL